MVVMLITPLLAGLFGLVAAQAEDAEAYLTRIRLLMLGAVGLGYIAVAWFCITRWSIVGAAGAWSVRTVLDAGLLFFATRRLRARGAP